MVYLCPHSGRRLGKILKVYNELGEWLHDIDGDDQAVEWLESKAYLGVGSSRRITHLIKVEPDERKTAAAKIQRIGATTYREHVGDYYVWAHARVAKTWIIH
jgi:hypothetical protein